MVGAELYSANKLTNPGAETGDTMGWAVSSVTVVSGGASGTKSFKLASTASMLQKQNSGNAQPSDFKIRAKYLPEMPADAIAVKVKARLRFTLTYADGTVDVSVLPCLGVG